MGPDVVTFALESHGLDLSGGDVLDGQLVDQVLIDQFVDDILVDEIGLDVLVVRLGGLGDLRGFLDHGLCDDRLARPAPHGLDRGLRWLGRASGAAVGAGFRVRRGLTSAVSTTGVDASAESTVAGLDAERGVTEGLSDGIPDLGAQ